MDAAIAGKPMKPLCLWKVWVDLQAGQELLCASIKWMRWTCMQKYNASVQQCNAPFNTTLAASLAATTAALANGCVFEQKAVQVADQLDCFEV